MRSPLVPAYYWAGNGSAIIHRLKGFDLEVDRSAYERAYDPERLRWLKETGGVNFVFLSYNWGLPPELEERDWIDFQAAAELCHRLGMGVAAYIQPSNAVAIGSNANAGWYAITPKGKRIPYYSGRYFTCLNDPGWRRVVLDRVRDAVARGADAIFLDNCAFGGMPIPLSNDYTAFAGCFCPRCQESFRRWQTARGEPPTGIPRLFQPNRNPVAREYAHWRAWTLTVLLREVRDVLKRLDPKLVLLTNTVSAVNVDTYNIHGVDLPEIANLVDWLFVENLQSPRAAGDMLVQNAGTFKLLQSLKPEAPTLSISYNRGIGVDGVPGPEVFARTMAEGYAAGGIPIIRACEYIENERWTLLQPGFHDDGLAAARRIVDFVRARSEQSLSRRSAAAVAVFVPPGSAWRGDVLPGVEWDYLGVIQALVSSAIPFRILTSLGNLGGVRVLIMPPGIKAPAAYRGLKVRYDQVGVRRRRRSVLAYFKQPFEPVLSRLGPWLVDSYFSTVHVRRFVDRLDLLFRLLYRDQCRCLLIDSGLVARMKAAHPCSVFSVTPIFVDLWETPAGIELHIVNYSDEPATVEVVSSLGEAGSVDTPDGPAVAINGGLRIESYAVLTWPTADQSRTQRASLLRAGTA
ncbi:MAG: hypothetical protein GEU28_08705 [Dehalococcoidia bacterium]|nr:hypothetical protein [Dehalococcoidia bacterium]